MPRASPLGPPDSVGRPATAAALCQLTASSAGNAYGERRSGAAGSVRRDPSRAWEPPVSPREVRQRVDGLDREIASREALRMVQQGLRQRFLLDDSPGGREALKQIERGIRPGEGCLSAIAELEGKPGLLRVEQDLLRLRERRAAWLEQLPRPEQTSAATQSASAKADMVRALAAKLDPEVVNLRDAVDALFPLAAKVSELTWQLHAANVSLDELCSESDIARPETPRRDAPSIGLASISAALLKGHCTGGQPMPVDENVTRELMTLVTSR